MFENEHKNSRPELKITDIEDIELLKEMLNEIESKKPKISPIYYEKKEQILLKMLFLQSNKASELEKSQDRLKNRLEDFNRKMGGYEASRKENETEIKLLK